MGFFDSAEEMEAKKVQKEVKGNIEKEGLSSLVSEADLLRVIVEQNGCLIRLAANNAISNAGIIGDALVISSTQSYYKSIKKYFNK